MPILKNFWVTLFATNDEMFTLSFESAELEEFSRVHSQELLFPAASPTRHVLLVKLLSQDDINLIAKVLDKHRTDL